MQSEREQVLLLGVRKYDTFTDRQGNTINAGCTVTLGTPYPSDNDNKFGYEFRQYTFRENIDYIFNKLRDINMPKVVLMEYHRDSAFSNNIVIDDINILE